MDVCLQVLLVPQPDRVLDERRTPPGEGTDAEGEAGEGQRRQDVGTILQQVLQILKNR